ncbi:MAG: transglycosylase SLT domain-containing protein [Acidobacteria bacterium]|nr:transglycosylase SLT domain-containing protein [Acidobacteriota bacterium]
MLFCNNLRKKFSSLAGGACLLAAALVLSTANCSAQPPEDASLSSLRMMTKDGKLPAEAVVANIESRFPGTQTAALARLLRGRIRLENGDPNGAAQLLDSEIFAQKTKLADYALWLRGKALLDANQDLQAQRVFEELIQKYPNSMRVRNGRLLWANDLLKSGSAQKIQPVLQPLLEKKDPDALLLMAQAYERSSLTPQAIEFYRKAYFFGAGTKAGDEAEKWLTAQAQDLKPVTPEEILARANTLYRKSSFSEAAEAYDELERIFPDDSNADTQLKRLTASAKAQQTARAQAVFNQIPLSSEIKEEAFYQLALGYAKARQWEQAMSTLTDMRQKFPKSKLTPAAMVDVGMAARDQRRKSDESYLLKLAMDIYPESIEVTKAQFEVAWMEHENKNYAVSARMLTEHLARYVDQDNSYRGQAGYWAARDSELAGLTDEACALYDAVTYRYGANWYGYLGLQRLLIMRRNGKCQTTPKFPVNSLIPKAVENMKGVVVVAETATAKELARADKSEELSAVGLFDWAIEELEMAKKTANESPKINLALAKHYRFKGDNVQALLSLAKSYPDYSQMFPEEMGKEEWDIFYPLTHWNDIKFYANKRNLDPYQVAGLIRQETIFNPNAKSGANAYGLMQLLIPTAKTMARKYSSTDSSSISGYSLFNPTLNIELGTAYMREQLDKYGRIEYMAVAYNAGPGRVVRWKAELPVQMDEFVEEIPFRETKGYVQGVIRNSAQYRRLYDLNGNFKTNVGTKPLRAAIDSIPPAQFAKEHPGIDVKRTKTAE